MKRTLTALTFLLTGLILLGCQPAPAAPPEGTFVGALEGDVAAIGIATHEGKVLAYACDGINVSEWFRGELTAGSVDLTSAGGAHLKAIFEGETASGTLTLANGDSAIFTAELAEGDAGLYRAEETYEGVDFVGGWVLLNDGRQVGAIGGSGGGFQAGGFGGSTGFQAGGFGGFGGQIGGFQTGGFGGQTGGSTGFQTGALGGQVGGVETGTSGGLSGVTNTSGETTTGTAGSSDASSTTGGSETIGETTGTVDATSATGTTDSAATTTTTTTDAGTTGTTDGSGTAGTTDTAGTSGTTGGTGTTESTPTPKIIIPAPVFTPSTGKVDTPFGRFLPRKALLFLMT